MAGLGSALSDLARAGGVSEHAVVPAAALHGGPASVAIGASFMTSAGPALTYGAPRGYRECHSVQEFCRMTSPDRSGPPILVAA
jgi:hypothetical protein